MNSNQPSLSDRIKRGVSTRSVWTGEYYEDYDGIKDCVGGRIVVDNAIRVLLVSEGKGGKTFTLPTNFEVHEIPDLIAELKQRCPNLATMNVSVADNSPIANCGYAWKEFPAGGYMADVELN